MYQTKAPLYPFGYGLSYTKFEYSDLSISGRTVSVTVKNVGDRDGDEVVQLYLDSAGLEHQPQLRLVGFRRLTLSAGEEQTVSFNLEDRAFKLFDTHGVEFFAHGTYHLYAGGSVPTERSLALGAAVPAETEFTI